MRVFRTTHQGSVGRFGWREVTAAALAVAVVLSLAGLVLANLQAHARWSEVEDGVFWSGRPEGVVAAAVAPRGPGDRAGIQQGDVLLAIDGQAVDSPQDVIDALHAQRRASRLTYTLLRLGAQELRQITLAPVPAGSRGLYVVMAAVALFTLLVGAAVRIRRPHDQATLHFFWLTIAFFGVFGFSYSGRLDRLDWIYYWADVVATLLLPPLFVHFALVFPERVSAWSRGAWGRAILPLLYLPAVLLGLGRVVVLAGWASGDVFTQTIDLIERLELVYLGSCVVGGLAVMLRALGRVRSITARRQLRWVVWGTILGGLPFTIGYVVPFALGMAPLPRMELTAIPLGLVPLAFASAIVRYRLMDVEVIIKRGLVYAAAVSLIIAIYFILERVATRLFLGGSQQHNSVIAVLATLVVVLLAPRVKGAIQTALDRAHYGERYDYRRALVGFARDLNSDLDIHRLSERLVARVMETLVVDRMALMLVPPESEPGGELRAICSAGFDAVPPPVLSPASGIGGRVLAGQTVVLDDPLAARRFTADEVGMWRRHGIYCLVPCVSKEGTMAVIGLGRKGRGEPLSSEDMALLAAVAGQVATALENGRLYRQLQLKAAELDRMREFSENIIESLSDGLVVIDLDDHVLRWNGAMERLCGVARGSAIGQPLAALFESDFVELLRRVRREVPAGTVLYRVPLSSRSGNGRRRLLINAATAPLQTPDGVTTGTMVILENITARVQLEEQLQISEKMASIGLLAAGVAHEINTPLTGISSFTQMLLQGAEADDPQTRVLEKIERLTFRAAKIVNGLLNLARPPHVESGPVDLNAVINDVLALVEHQLKVGRVTLRKELSATPPIVQGFEYKLQQVFLNLFLNARDAMPRGGWLAVATHEEDGRAVVEVGDTGVGIPREHLSRIYDPFFTTKPIGQGTGLGLSIAYGIVQEHAGSITCDSTLGQGTRFALTLPLAAGRRAQPTEAVQ